MIQTRKQLRETLRIEKPMYMPKGSGFELVLTNDNKHVIYRYVVALRKTEFHYNNRKNSLHKMMYVLYRRKKNRLGRKLGIELSENTFDEGLMIYHPAGIVVNGYTRVGKQCLLHGNNCIGNNGIDYKAPVLGDRVRLGVGAKIIGDVTIADDVTIAAGAVVIESCETPGAVLAGIPAKCVKVKNLDNEVTEDE